MFMLGVWMIISNIMQIAMAVAIIGVAILAMGAGVVLLKKGLGWAKEKM